MEKLILVLWPILWAMCIFIPVAAIIIGVLCLWWHSS